MEITVTLIAVCTVALVWGDQYRKHKAFLRRCPHCDDPKVIRRPYKWRVHPWNTFYCECTMGRECTNPECSQCGVETEEPTYTKVFSPFEIKWRQKVKREKIA